MPVLKTDILSMSVQYDEMPGYDSSGCLVPSQALQSKYYLKIQYQITNIGGIFRTDTGIIVGTAACGTPAIMNFLHLNIAGSDSSDILPIDLKRAATCVIDDSLESSWCHGSTNSQQLMIINANGGTYGATKRVFVKFPLTTAQFNVLSGSGSSSITFTLSVNPDISGGGAAAVVSTVVGSQLSPVMWKSDTSNHGTSQDIIFPISCATTIGPDAGTTSVSGHQSDQSLSSVCLSTDVQSVVDNAFSNYGYGGSSVSSITYLFTPPYVTIGFGAFYATPLTTVIFGGAVQIIGDSAFAAAEDSLSHLTTLKFAGAVGSIGDNAFRRIALTTLTFPGYVGYIGQTAFYNAALTTVIFDGAVGTIKNYAFLQCSSLATLTFQGYVLSIGFQAFYATSLTTVIFGGTVGSIGNNAFDNGDSSPSHLTTLMFAGAVGSIGDNAFRSTSLTTLTFPGTVGSIGQTAFYNAALTTVTFGGAVGTIKDYAFLQCSSLTTLTFLGGPSAPTFGGNNVFVGTALTTVNYPNSWADFQSNAVFQSLGRSVSFHAV